MIPREVVRARRYAGELQCCGARIELVVHLHSDGWQASTNGLLVGPRRASREEAWAALMDFAASELRTGLENVTTPSLPAASGAA